VIPGDGNALISFTDRRDVGRYVAYVLTMLPQKSLGNREFRIEGQRVVRVIPEAVISTMLSLRSL